jgi:hypothetical protein
MKQRAWPFYRKKEKQYLGRADSVNKLESLGQQAYGEDGHGEVRIGVGFHMRTLAVVV